MLAGSGLKSSVKSQARTKIRIGASLSKTMSESDRSQIPVRILVTAPSNSAVDEIIVRLIREGVFNVKEKGFYRPNIVRVGRPDGFSSSKNKNKVRKYAKEVEPVLLETMVEKQKDRFNTSMQVR